MSIIPMEERNMTQKPVAFLNKKNVRPTAMRILIYKYMA